MKLNSIKHFFGHHLERYPKASEMSVTIPCSLYYINNSVTYGQAHTPFSLTLLPSGVSAVDPWSSQPVLSSVFPHS